MAVQPAAAVKTLFRTPKGEYEEEMRLLSVGRAGCGAHCYRYAGARRFVKENMTLLLRVEKNQDQTRHPSTGGAGGGMSCCGGGGGGAANSPWTGP